MRARTIVECNILCQHPAQVLLVHNEDVIETLLANGAHPALGYGIRRGARYGVWIIFIFSALRYFSQYSLPSMDMSGLPLLTWLFAWAAALWIITGAVHLSRNRRHIHHDPSLTVNEF
jgi:hypothetical protein